MSITRAAVILTFALAASLGACSSAQKSKPAASAAPINKVCPIGGDSTEGTDLTTTFQGKTVGFCCQSCVDKWNKLSDADRSAKLNAAMATK